MATLATACLVTQNPVEREGTVTTNHPPRFDDKSITPPNSVCIKPTGSPTCDLRNFKADTVIDEDIADNLVARWFVDCDGTRATLVAEGPITSIPTPGSQGERVGGPSLAYTFHPSDFAPGVHVVKVLVSDGFAYTTENHNLDLAAETRGLATWVWCVDTSLCSGTGGGQ